MLVSQRICMSAALSALVISLTASAQQAAAPAVPSAPAVVPAVTPAATPAVAPAVAPATVPAAAPADAVPLDPVAKLKKDLSAIESDKGTTINLSGDLTFDFNQANVRTEVGPTLTKLADLVRKSKKTVTISGHTDTQGNAEYNKKLSELRAGAVKAALVQRGILASRIKTAGYGADQPKTANANPDGTDNPKGREVNRRVEVLIAKK